MPKGHKTRLAAALAAGMLACGADWGALQPQGYVSDFGSVVAPESRRRIEAYCAAVEKATGAQLALVTVPGLDGEPVEDVANLLYRKWGVGKKGENNGVLLLLSIGDRRSRLEVGYGLEPVLPDGVAGEILREMRPALRTGNFGEALLTAAHQIGERIAHEKGVRIDAAAPPHRVRRNTGPGISWVAMLLLVLALLFFTSGGGGGPWWLLPMMMSRGRGGSGGGFGGYDSGGGFGGFGGGDSGGGGASSDW